MIAICILVVTLLLVLIIECFARRKMKIVVSEQFLRELRMYAEIADGHPETLIAYGYKKDAASKAVDLIDGTLQTAGKNKD